MPFDADAFERHFSRGAPQNLKCRLLEEGNGRWKAFQDDMRRMCEDGVSIEEATKLVQRKYTPLPAEFLPPPPPPPVMEVPVEEKPAGSVPWRKVIAWVFENVGKYPEPEEAPAKGAFELLCWVQETPVNRKEFYTTIWPRILPTKAMVEEQYGKEEETDDVLIGEIGSILFELDAELAAEDRLVSDDPEGLPPELAVAPETSGPGTER